MSNSTTIPPKPVFQKAGIGSLDSGVIPLKSCDAPSDPEVRACWGFGKPVAPSSAEAEKLVGRVVPKHSDAASNAEEQRRIIEADQLANSRGNSAALTPIFEQTLAQMQLQSGGKSKAAENIKQEFRNAWNASQSMGNLAFANRTREQLLKFVQDQRMVPSVVADAAAALYTEQKNAAGETVKTFDPVAALVLFPALRAAPVGQFGKLQDQQESRLALWNEATETNNNPEKLKQGYARIDRSQLFSSNPEGINRFESEKDVSMGFIAAMASDLNLDELTMVGTPEEQKRTFMAYYQEALRNLKEGLPLIQEKGLRATFGQNTDDGIMMNTLGPQIHKVLEDAEFSGGIAQYVRLSKRRKDTENPVVSPGMVLTAAGMMMSPFTGGASAGGVLAKPAAVAVSKVLPDKVNRGLSKVGDGLERVDEALTLNVKSQAGKYENRMLEAMQAARKQRGE
jgi:hypothetical protein